jgi:Ca2+-binding EF-hand superfamily protein
MKKLICAIAVIAAAAAAPALAQPAQTPSEQPDLTRNQALERADQLFDRFDLNHDGIVTRKEAQSLGRRLLMQRAATGRDVAPGIGGHTLRFLEHTFAGMQSVTKRQFEEAMLAHFDQMDVNRDGVLTAAEREAGRALPSQP